LEVVAQQGEVNRVRDRLGLGRVGTDETWVRLDAVQHDVERVPRFVPQGPLDLIVLLKAAGGKVVVPGRHRDGAGRLLEYPPGPVVSCAGWVSRGLEAHDLVHESRYPVPGDNGAALRGQRLVNRDRNGIDAVVDGVPERLAGARVVEDIVSEV